MRLTVNTKIGDLLKVDPDVAGILQSMGMHCIGCPSSQNETLEQACEVHDLDADEVLEDIKGFLGAF